jgi:hypothetical protein
VQLVTKGRKNKGQKVFFDDIQLQSICKPPMQFLQPSPNILKIHRKGRVKCLVSNPKSIYHVASREKLEANMDFENSVLVWRNITTLRTHWCQQNIQSRPFIQQNKSCIYFWSALMLSAAAPSTPKHTRTACFLKPWPFHFNLLYRCLRTVRGFILWFSLLGFKRWAWFIIAGT